MTSYKLPSGAELEVTPLDFEPAFEISQVVTRFIGLLDVDLTGMDPKQWNSIADIDLAAIKRPLSQVLSNSDLRKAGDKCLVKCTYNGQKVTTKTWEPVEARQDYLYAIFFAMKENVMPFFEGAFSSLKA
jgi:hypothetical protein